MMEHSTQSNDKYEQIYNNSSLIKFIIDSRSGDINAVNEATCLYYGYTKEEMLKMNIEDISKLSKKEVIENIKSKKISKTEFCRCEHRLSTGEMRAVKMYGSFLKGKNKELLSIVVQDVESVSVFGEEYVKSKAYFDSLFNNSPEAIAIVNKDFKILNINDSFKEIFQYDFSEVQNEDLTEVLCEPILYGTTFDFRKTVMEGKFISEELKRQRKDGTTLDVLLMAFPLIINGEISEAYCIYSDITEMKAQESQIKELTYNDNLTGLFNKEFFSESLKIEMYKKINDKNIKTKLAVMMVSINEFKEINDVFGHQISDLMFIGFSARLRENIGREYMIARANEDSLAILMADVYDKEEINDLTKLIIATLDKSFNIETNDLQVSVNIGISIYPDDGTEYVSLIRKAEIALERSKISTENTPILFENSFDREVQEYFWLKKDLLLAVEKDELFLNYQPIYDIKKNVLVGVEALVRWKHSEYGVIPPSKFIPLSEDSGIINGIGEWVLLTACKQNKTWQEMGYENISISVNVSVVQLENPNFIGIVRKVLEETQLDPKYLQLEITESVFTSDYKLIQKVIKEIKKMGIRFAIDDFGTGYSSLSQLFELDINNFKMDQLFITDIDTNSSKAKIVRATILLAESLDVSLTAEGVSTEEELKFLKDNNCPLGQGYLLSKPLEAGKLQNLLTK